MAEPYPWYGRVTEDDLQQGDIIEACPVFIPPEDLAERPLETASFLVVERDLIVMSQSCDLEKGQEKLSEVLLCAVWQRSEMPAGHALSRPEGLENVRKGRVPAWHILAPCELQGLEREARLVEFQRTHSLPLTFIRRRAAASGERIRLLPPYREHLAQAFARFFMRVGLPIDIPPFTKR
jgi:hypothetical protein